MNCYKPLPREFYKEHAILVAKKLLGKILIREYSGTTLAGKIVEVEAYRGGDDPASHAYRGVTRRNWVMWGKPGTAYVYVIYGLHFCLNVVVEPEGVPAAVLIRAVEPLEGLDIMLMNRPVKHIRDLTSGPAKLTKAFNIDIKFNGWDLTLGKELFIAWGEDIPEDNIISSPRIGVQDERPWRFYIAGNQYVSG